MFQGEFLDCNSLPNEIVLLHSRFSIMPAGTCNGGKVYGHSLSFNDTEACYTSQLHVMVCLDMIGKCIICVNDNGTTTEEIGNFSIEKCHATIVTTTAPSTGKLVTHV